MLFRSVEGAALLATPFFGFAQTGVWGERGTNNVDSGAPYYDAYETADGKWLAVGAIEPHFYADLVALLELPDDLPDQNDRAQWPQMKKVFADAVRGRTLTEWRIGLLIRLEHSPAALRWEMAVHLQRLAR